ncbi:MAG: monothiol bacilliredoxin BrxC family protein [Dehalococcoidia bacterium]
MSKMNVQADFRPVADTAALDDVVRSSYDAPAVLFLDDPYCPVSERAYQEVARVPSAIAQVDVSEHSALSREIERRTGIRHESPQLIVLRDGQPVWSASHGHITADAIARTLAAHAAPAG